MKNCHTTMIASDAAATASAVGLKLGKASCRACNMPKKSAGIFCTFRPSRSLTCESAISTAMPLVKPITTAIGMKRTSVPSRSTPMRNSSTPDNAVAMMRLPRP